MPAYTYDSYKTLWDMGNGAEMLQYSATSPDGYTSYLNDLANSGFTKYAENEIAGNLFSTWTSNEFHVTMIYIPSQKCTRILVEPSTMSLPTRSSDNVYADAGIENVVVQISANYNGQLLNGMCYAYRLCDGSFILVDSGFNSSECADAIYETLVKLAPDPDNIVIASWFITHPHRDHIDGFSPFASKYSSKVKLEQVIYNCPTEKIFTLCNTSVTHLTDFLEHTEMFENCELVEAHPGQEFYIRDAYIEMLYTWDLFNKSTITEMNNTSLVFTVTINDTKAIMLGDCGILASPIITNAYGDYIKSDYIQVAHHDLIGATAELNQLIDPDVVMWLADTSVYNAYIVEGYNKIFASKENLYVAGTAATMIPLPFDAEKVQIWELYENN